MRVDWKERVRFSGPYCFGMPKAPGLRARDPSAQHHFLNLQENKLSEVSHSGQTLQAPSLRQQQGPAGRTSAFAKANQLALFQPRRTGSQKGAPEWRTRPAGRGPVFQPSGFTKGPSLKALLFSCGEGAVCEARRLEDRGRGPQAQSVPQALFVRFGGWNTSQRASYLVGSDSDVRHWGPLPAGPVLLSGPCCFVVARGAVCKLCWRLEDTHGKAGDVFSWNIGTSTI